ncbi:MAG: hypothetical protein ACK5AZ_24015 [Bryobacteraceae bacterium]
MRSISLFAPITCAFLFVAYAQQPLVPANQIPDEIAATALFYVVGAGPQPHWDDETRANWLKNRGFTELEASHIISAATRFRMEHAEIEGDLVKVNQAHRGDVQSQAARQQREEIRIRVSRLLATRILELEHTLGPIGASKFRQHLAAMKHEIKMKSR